MGQFGAAGVKLLMAVVASVVHLGFEVVEAGVAVNRTSRDAVGTAPEVISC